MTPTRDPLPIRARAATLYALTRLAGRLPYRWLRALGSRHGLRSRRANSKTFRITVRNLELAGLGEDAAGRAEMAGHILRNTWATLLETLRIWTRPAADGLALVHGVEGIEHYQAARRSGRGLMIATPHYSNWELLACYLATLEPIAVLYRPPDSRAADIYMHRVRSRPGVTPVRADANGVRQLVKTLRHGGMVGILPDQQPKAGEGSFAPFFGRQALTMTLYSKLAAKTGAAMLVAYSERDGDGYRVRFEPMPDAAAGDDAAALAALNHRIEGVVRRDPSQYQWTYKRFKFRPPGSGEENPYWPDCYGRADRPKAT